ncbi:ABC transporter permease [Flavobacteriaceae bacterium R38]|nr:ABC transporter permease [Flavobacteriaceae bacterium R38]
MIKLVYKDFKLLMSNKRDVLLTFLLPIALSTLFALVFGRMGTEGQVNMGGIVQAIVGTAIMMALFSVAEIGASFLGEKEEGMLKKLLWAPLPKSHILYGKILFANIMVGLQLLIVFIYGKIAFGLDIFINVPAIILMVTAVSYASSGFGVFLAAIGRSRKQVQAYATLIILVMSGIGGSMMPVNMMPDFMQKVSMFSVNYWGMQGFYDVFLRDRGLTDHHFLQALLVLILIGTLLNTIAFILFKKNLNAIT